MDDYIGSLRSELAFESAEALVVRLKAREETAFSEAFALYHDLVYSLAYKMLADKTAAMDVTQEVFLILFRKIDRFRGDCSLKTWLYRVTLNQAANQNRWWKRRLLERTISLNLDVVRGEASAGDPVSPRPLADREVHSKELRAAIESGLSQLPFEQRAAVILRDLQGASYEEISEICGVNVGTIKSRIARGRERLREILRAFDPQGEV